MRHRRLPQTERFRKVTHTRFILPGDHRNEAQPGWVGNGLEGASQLLGTVGAERFLAEGRAARCDIGEREKTGERHMNIIAPKLTSIDIHQYSISTSINVLESSEPHDFPHFDRADQPARG